MFIYGVAKGTNILAIKDYNENENNGTIIEIPIEEVKVGDYVYSVKSYNNYPFLKIKKVIWTEKQEHKKVIRLKFNFYEEEKYIDTIAEYKIMISKSNDYLKVKGYKEINKLNNNSGFYIYSDSYDFYDGCEGGLFIGHPALSKENIEYLNEETDVYGIKVEGAHNFVANGIVIKDSFC